MLQPPPSLKLVAASVGVLAAATLFASNIGSSIRRDLVAADGGVQSLSGRNAVCLPYQTGPLTADDLLQEVNAQAGSSAVVAIEKFLTATDTVLEYDGTVPANNFPLEAGSGYTIVVNADVNYHIIGSHDPQSVVKLLGANHANSLTGRNPYCAPYNASASTAEELIAEINLRSGTNAVVSVSKFLASSDTALTYAGINHLNNFPLDPGTGYEIQMTTSVDYVPSLR